MEKRKRSSEEEDDPKKKRGRKPKTAKIVIIEQPTPMMLEEKKEELVVDEAAVIPPPSAIMLHLKCSLKDLNTSGATTEVWNIPPEPVTVVPGSNNERKEIARKLRTLEHQLHHNLPCNRKSACFWCTCDFDNPAVRIPRSATQVYGCFCSPECACAYLMKEHIDTSTKFERLHLLHHLYSYIYQYEQRIKPAPDPYYTLDKYYGNLSIQEYRSLFKHDRLFLVVEKPLTKVLPELHEDNDDFIVNNKVIPSHSVPMRNNHSTKPSKHNILHERFGGGSSASNSGQ